MNKVLLNTTFFFTPKVATAVQTTLRDYWLPACGSCGESMPLCMKMPSEGGVDRLAIQTPFASEELAQRFLSEVLEPIAGKMVGQLGADAFTCFSTLMEIVDL